MTPDILLPKKARKYILLTFALLGLALGAAAVWFSSTGDVTPIWLVKAAAVDAFIVSAPLFMAALNINKDDSDNLKPNKDAFDPKDATVALVLDAEGDDDEDEENAGLDVILAPKD